MTLRFAKLVPARPDLAALSLKGQTEAARYAEPQRHVVCCDVAPMRGRPDPDAGLETELLRGQAFDVYEMRPDGWTWGQALLDGYVGYVPAAALALPGPPPTHRVTVPRTFVFPGPSIKLPPVAAPPLGARLAVTGIFETFAVLAEGGHVPLRHLAPIEAPALADPVAVARLFLGVPYLWGGKTALGLDCSGLTQIAFAEAGHALLRDSGMQEQTVGAPVAIDDPVAAARRGDLVFWPGHVGLMATDTTMIHANAHFMQVTEEPLAEAVRRIAERGDQVRAIRRISSGL